MAKKSQNLESLFKDFGDQLKTQLDKVLEMAFRPASMTASVTKFANVLQTSLGTALGQGVKLALAPVSAALQVFAVATSKDMQLIRSLVEKANPAAVFKFDRALDDLAGTMGQILLPILNAVTGFIREFADVMQAMKPALAPTVEVITMTIRELTRLIEPLTGLLIPTFMQINAVINLLVIPAMEGMIYQLQIVTEAFNTLTFGLFEITKQSSVGAAVRPAAYSKVEDIGKRTTLSALQGTGTDTGKQMVEEQKKSNGFLATIAGGKRDVGKEMKSGAIHALKILVPITSIFD